MIDILNITSIQDIPLLLYILPALIIIWLSLVIISATITAHRIRAFSKVIHTNQFLKISDEETGYPWFYHSSTNVPFFFRFEKVKVHNANEGPAFKTLASAIYIPLYTTKSTDDILYAIVTWGKLWFHINRLFLKPLTNYIGKIFPDSHHILASLDKYTLYSPEMLPRQVRKVLSPDPTMVLRFGLASKHLSMTAIHNRLNRVLSKLTK